MSHAKRNWSQYNKNLVKRGRIDCWIDPKFVEKWQEMGKLGRPKFHKNVIKLGLGPQ